MSQLLLPLLCAGIFVLCNMGAKLSLIDGRGWLMYPVSIGAIAAYIVFRMVCENNSLSISSGKIDSLVTVISIIIGIFILGENLNIKQYIGLALILLGLFLIK